MGGGMNDYHRQARKKEIKKNKEKRVAERDARVVQQKTAADVQVEIRKLTRQHKDKDKEGNDVKLPHAIQSKLDRLKKELKLLEAAEETGDQKGPATVVKKAAAPAWTPLAHPQLSVYFDATLNPYGEPPPGQPRMYHTAAGGTTFRLEEAALPGSRPPPPPPPRQPEPWRRPPMRDERRSNDSNREDERNRPPQPPAERRPPPPPPPPPLPKGPPPAKASTGGSRNQKEATNAAAAAPKTIPPVQAPSLPPPSQSVRRGRARLDADIWATSDEIDYHQAADLSLEGVDTVMPEQQKKTSSFTEWWYQDRMGQVQGPFAHEQMLGWMGAGFFTTTVRARPRTDAPWKPVLHYAVFRKILQGEKKEDAKVEKEVSVQDRMAALRQEEPQEMSVADRIAALRGDAPEPVPEPTQEMSVADRIAALRGEAPENAPADDDFDEDMLPPPPPPLESSHYMPSYDMADEEVNEAVGEMLPPPPPPPPSAGSHLDEPAPYDIDISVDGMPPPPPPPLASEPYDLPAYTIDDISPYDTDHAVGDYPVDMSYPVEDDTPVTDGYPMVDSYPTTGPHPEAPPPPKRIKVDREVVSFLPSNLQKRKK